MIPKDSELRKWIKSLKKNIEEIGEVKLDLRVLPVLEKLLARLKEKQKEEVPTVEEIEKLIEKTRLQIRKTGYLMEEHKVNKAIAEVVQELMKSKQIDKVMQEASNG